MGVPTSQPGPGQARRGRVRSGRTNLPRPARAARYLGQGGMRPQISTLTSTSAPASISFFTSPSPAGQTNPVGPTGREGKELTRSCSARAGLQAWHVLSGLERMCFTAAGSLRLTYSSRAVLGFAQFGPGHEAGRPRAQPTPFLHNPIHLNLSETLGHFATRRCVASRESAGAEPHVIISAVTLKDLELLRTLCCCSWIFQIFPISDITSL